MTRDSEMEILRQAILLLGEDSYCGPWLSSVLAEVERDIRDDILPAQTISAARAEAEKIRLAAEAEAKAIRESAGIAARNKIDEAIDYCEGVKSRFRRDLDNAIRVLSN